MERAINFYESFFEKQVDIKDEVMEVNYRATKKY